MVAFRKKGGNCHCAMPIDPLYKRLEAKVHKRRDTKAVTMFHYPLRSVSSSTRNGPLDLVLFAANLCENHLKEGSSTVIMERSLQGLVLSTGLLQKLRPSHPVLQPDSFPFGGLCPFLPCGSMNDCYEAGGEDLLVTFATRHGYGCSPFGVVTSRGHHDTFRWLVERFPDCWNEQEASRMIRVAAWCGKNEMVEYLIEANGNRGFLAAVNGAAEAGLTANVKALLPGSSANE